MLLRKKWRTELEAVDCTASYIRLGKKKNQWSVVKNCCGNTQQGPVLVSQKKSRGTEVQAEA